MACSFILSITPPQVQSPSTQATLSAIAAPVIKSSSVLSCITDLSAASTLCDSLSLHWIPGQLISHLHPTVLCQHQFEERRPTVSNYIIILQRPKPSPGPSYIQTLCASRQWTLIVFYYPDRQSVLSLLNLQFKQEDRSGHCC